MYVEHTDLVPDLVEMERPTLNPAPRANFLSFAG
jgi:hypothetical protein